ncbi:MAG: YwaF family protein [Clostridia bacterium]|nr:YwaF family protein [Clostridia bacterium]
MNKLGELLCLLQTKMPEATAWGWFHLMWIAIIIISLIILYKVKDKSNEKQLKIVLGVYGIVALILEVTKQLIWTFDYNAVTNTFSADFQWYAFPFQLCTTPIFVSILCLFMKRTKLRLSLLSYMAFVTILGSFMTVIIPDDCLVETILINVHTMWLHCGNLVVSIYLLMSGAVEINKQNFKNAIKVFIVFVILAQILNVGVYNSGILGDETFNMFYISPYFISSLPVFDTIQQNVPYPVYLALYVIALSLGAGIVYMIAKIISNIINKKEKVKIEEK